MQKIYDLIEEIYGYCIIGGEIKKTTFHENLHTLNDLLTEKLGDIKVNNVKFKHIMIKSPLERLQELENKLSTLSTGPEMLTEAILLGEDKMRLFLKKYNIGFLKNIKLNQSGIFTVEVPCMINNHSSFHNKDYSKKVEFEYQLDLLKSLGFELCESKLAGNKSPAILATQKSIETMEKLINDLGGMGLHQNLATYKGQTTIRSIEFRISPETLYKFDETPVAVTCTVSENLNADELLHLAHELRELISVLKDYSDKDLEKAHDACKNIILHTFSTICDIVELETPISISVKDAHADAKRINELVREKEELIKQAVEPEKIKDFAGKVMGKIEKFGAEKIGFSCLDIDITHRLTANLRYDLCGYIFCSHCDDEVENITKEKLMETFEIYPGTYDEENLVILNTKENIDKLNSIIMSNFDGARIENIEVGYKDFVGYYVQKISVTFPNLNMF